MTGPWGIALVVAVMGSPSTRRVLSTELGRAHLEEQSIWTEREMGNIREGCVSVRMRERNK